MDFVTILPTHFVPYTDMRTEEQEDRRTGGLEDKNKGGQENRKTGEQEKRRTGRHEEDRSATFCQVPLLPNCNLPMFVYRYTLSVINLLLTD